MSSMHEVSEEGHDQYEAWLAEHLSEVGQQFVENARRAGRLSDDQARLLEQESAAMLMEDPYGVEAFVSAWSRAPHARKVYLVAAYHRSRRYGGPEEGGWWYDHHDPLTEAYGRSHSRSFLITGPHDDQEDAYEVARDLNACESIGYRHQYDCPIVWRVVDHIPFSTRPAVYC